MGLGSTRGEVRFFSKLPSVGTSRDSRHVFGRLQRRRFWTASSQMRTHNLTCKRKSRTQISQANGGEGQPLDGTKDQQHRTVETGEAATQGPLGEVCAGAD